MEDEVLSRADLADDGGGEEGWRPDPEQPGQERFWDGYEWTDQVRPDALEVRREQLPEHAPELQRALAAATADIDSVEDRLSALFDRSGGAGGGRGDEPAGPRSSTTLWAESGQLEANSAFSSGRNADENWDGCDDDDVIVLADFHEDPEEFEDAEHVAAHELDDDDVLLDVDAALRAEAPEEF
jgi:hypothetical protein